MQTSGTWLVSTFFFFFFFLGGNLNDDFSYPMGGYRLVQNLKLISPPPLAYEWGPHMSLWYQFFDVFLVTTGGNRIASRGPEHQSGSHFGAQGIGGEKVEADFRIGT